MVCILLHNLLPRRQPLRQPRPFFILQINRFHSYSLQFFHRRLRNILLLTNNSLLDPLFALQLLLRLLQVGIVRVFAIVSETTPPLSVVPADFFPVDHHHVVFGVHHLHVFLQNRLLRVLRFGERVFKNRGFGGVWIAERSPHEIRLGEFRRRLFGLPETCNS